MFGKDKKEEFKEKILYETQPNIFVYSKGILISMFVLGFLFFLYSAGISYIGNMNVYLIESTKVPMARYFAIAVFVLIMIVFLYIILKLLIWTSIKYTITESRVIVEKGILLQKRNYMPFNTIQDVSRSQSLFGKIFSVGTITLYSAYDGKDLELKDVSSPKKIEDIIFENMRGTHLRYRNIYDDDFSSDFNPIRPNSGEPNHYRRMEDLDDLELVDAKERKRQLRDIRRKARNSRNNPNYNSDYNSNYNSEYGSDYKIQKMISEGKLFLVGKSVYSLESNVPFLAVLAYKYPNAIVTMHTAFYLHGLTDREPALTTVAVPKGYNSTHLGKDGVRVIHTKPEWFEIGISRGQTGFGNEVPVYDRERTICDIIRFKKDVEIQTFQTAMKEYMRNKGKNLGNLIGYARALGIEEKVRTYTEMML